MPPARLLQLPRLSLKAKGVLLVVMSAYFLAMPVLDARRDLAGDAPPIGYPEVVLACYEDPALDDAAERLALYLDARDPLIDRLLPAGEGGTRFFETLGDEAGLAIQAQATVAISLEHGLSSSAGEVEMHERAHLAQVYLAREAADLLRGLPRPAPGEYAARNAGEHFAEMAARAWQVVEVLRPKDVCVDGAPIDWLREAETDVPGTSGFVAWYLDQPALVGVEGREALRSEAARLMASQQSAWQTIAASLESRKRPDGTFTPWPRPSLREYLEAQRWAARIHSGLGGRLRATQLSGALALLGLFDASVGR